MILVDMENQELRKFHSDIVKMTSRIDLEYDVVLSPMLQSKNEFDYYRDVLPFFKNVQKGVKDEKI